MKKWFYIAFGLVLLFLLAGYVLPPLASVRSRRPAPCFRNLSQIGKALKMYSMDHQDRFPGSLSELIPKYISENEILRCPKSGTRNQHVAYVIVPGLSETNASNSVHVYCPTGSHGGKGGNILFVDGSVCWYQIDEFNKALQKDPNKFQEDIVANAPNPQK